MTQTVPPEILALLERHPAEAIVALVAAGERFADARTAVDGFTGDLTGAEFIERTAAWRAATTALANATFPLGTKEKTHA